MDKDILIALIGAGAVIIAAVIGGVGANFVKKKVQKNKTNVNQSSKGDNVTMIGVQNYQKDNEKDEEREAEEK